jgi:hypothetical protein
MAQLAQRVEVSSPLPSHDGYRSAFGDNPAQLGEMVSYRLQSLGVDASTVEWDSWRRADGTWNVVARFEPAPGSAASVGEEPPAQWTFNPGRRTVLNANRWAQVLSELEPLDGPLPARRLSAVADKVFDFEAEREAEPEPESSADELLDVLRSRRGQRLGEDEDEDDALALMLSQGSIPAAHPREGAVPAADDGSDDGSNDGMDRPEENTRSGFPPLTLAPALQGSFGDTPAPAASGWTGVEEFHRDNDDDGLDESGTPRLFDGVSTDTREISMFARAPRAAEGGVTADEADERPSASGTNPDRPGQDPDRKIRPRRSSVPSWDEIVFGTKGD